MKKGFLLATSMLSFLFIFVLCPCGIGLHFSTTTMAYASGEIVPDIVGGHDAERGAWPWIAALARPDKNPYQGQFCGGSLIDPRWVVTAAHCVTDDKSSIVPASTITVILGIHDLKKDTDWKRYKLKRIIRHPRYDSKTQDSDIALLELAEDASQYGTLPAYDGSSSFDGRISTVIGWGNTSSSGEKYPSILQEVSLPIISNDVCKDSYSTDSITANMMCAGYAGGGKDSCQGDSGGPLVIKQGKKWKLAGVVSWGYGCAKPDYYGVYTRVSKFADFVYAPVTATFIDGKVTTSTDGYTNVGVKDVAVSIKGTNIIAKTDRSGSYNLMIPRGALNSGEYTVIFKAKSYKTATATIEFIEGQNLTLNKRISR